MQKIEARFRVITPLFLGGAEPDVRAELRVPSIKGALRFWWRALAWARYAGDLEKLRVEEMTRFGSSDAGQSKVLLSLKAGSSSILTAGEVLKIDGKTLGPGARYLGYGVMEAFDGKNTVAGRLTRPCLLVPLQFTLTLVARNTLPDDVVDAVKLLGLLGGLGSRARKGYGSLCVSTIEGDLEPWTAPSELEGYCREVSQLLAPALNLSREPAISAFSSLARVDVLLEDNRPLDALDVYGRQMQRYRSWGRNNKVNGKRSEQNFPEDHDWAKGERPAGFHPKRAVFGLPHNYGKKRQEQVAPAQHDRRASPLLFHVHELSGSRYLGVSVLLHSAFLLNGEQIRTGEHTVPQNVDYGTIERFLDGAGAPPGEPPRPYFPRRRILWPEESA